MPGCKNRADPPAFFPAIFLALAAVAVLAACGEQRQGGQFEVDRVAARWANGLMNVTFEQRLRLSEEARDALEHGVPLTVGVELVLRDARTRTRVRENESHYEIRYLPLSEHYRLTGPDGEAIQTYPRLRHALADLGNLELSFETGALPSGEYELLARSFLDKRKMPPPMRLPVLFSSRWDHESDWTSWPLEIKPGA
jgi:hypothetical protein